MEVAPSAPPEKEPLKEKSAQPAKLAPEVLPKPVRPPRPPKMTPAKVIRAAEPAAPPAPAPVKGIEEKKEEETSKKEKVSIKKTLKTTRVSPETETAKSKVFKKRKEILERAALYDDAAREGRRGKGVKSGKSAAKKYKKTEITTPKAIKRRLKISEAITVGELAKRLGVKSGELMKKLIALGLMLTLNQSLDYEAAALVATEFGYEAEKVSFEEEQVVRLHADQPEELEPRPPVVTIMGHVDHGKTSSIRLDPKNEYYPGGSRWDHPAYRGVSRKVGSRRDRFPGYPGP